LYSPAMFQKVVYRVLTVTDWLQGRKQCARKAEPKRAKKAKQTEASCCTSDNDSNVSQESAEAGDVSPKGKARAGRGAATDPQSLYARVHTHDKL
jgi:hypothetical protein